MLKTTNFSIKNVFTVLIILMWVTSFIVNLLNPKYDPPVYVNPLIMLVGGYFFAVSIVSKDKEKK